MQLENQVQAVAKRFGAFGPVAVFAVLTACGGGGGGGSTAASTSTSPSMPGSTPVVEIVSAKPTPPSIPGLIPAMPIVSLTPTTLTFQLTAFGVTSAPMTQTISNVGNAPLVLTSFSTTGPFRVIGGSCLSNGAVQAGGSCTAILNFTPTTHGASPAANLTFFAQSLPDTVVPLVGTSPSAVAVTVGSKMYTLDYPTAFANLLNIDPGALTTDSTASLWSLVSSINTFDPVTTALTTPQLIASIPWPIKFALWSKTTGGGLATAVTGNGCQIDLVGPNLVITVNGESISVAVDGTPPVLYNGNQVFPGDVLIQRAFQQGSGAVGRSVEIDAFSGSNLGDNKELTLNADYVSQGNTFGPGVHGRMLVSVTSNSANRASTKQYRCTDQ